MTPEETKTFLRRSAVLDRLAGSFLLYGGTLAQRRELGLFLGQLVCCEAAEKPCGACPECARVAKGVHPDIRIISPERGTLPIDAVRDVKDELYLTPYAAPKKVYVLELETMKDEAANAFLKMLEEPPPHGVLVLSSATTNYFLPTIISRCRRLRLNFVLPEYDQTAEKSREAFLALLSAAAESRFDPLFKGVDKLGRDLEREEVGSWLEEAAWLYRDALFAEMGVSPALLVNRAVDGKIHGSQGALVSLERVLEMRRRTRYNVNIKLELDALFLQLTT